MVRDLATETNRTGFSILVDDIEGLASYRVRYAGEYGVETEHERRVECCIKNHFAFVTVEELVLVLVHETREHALHERRNAIQLFPVVREYRKKPGLWIHGGTSLYWFNMFFDA
jgi:hypothetical protein